VKRIEKENKEDAAERRRLREVRGERQLERRTGGA